MAEEFHLTGPFQHQPPSPDHQTLRCDCNGHLYPEHREVPANHADQNRHGGEKADIYQSGYAGKSKEKKIKEQTLSTESKLELPGKKHLRVQGSSYLHSFKQYPFGKHFFIMVAFSTVALFVTLRSLLLLAPASPVGATPVAPSLNASASAPIPLSTAVPHGVNSTHGTNSSKPAKLASSNYWLANIQRQGAVAFGDSNFQIYRNVMDFGAKGDGSTDDTAAIQNAISSGNRCGQGCDSSTLTPAIIYFPPGTYVVSSPLNQNYFTQMIGDALNLPTIKASAGFQGMAVIDADPYVNGVNWFTNQNNFYRQIRNFVIDLTAMPPSAGAGIHWQVAQATSIQNVVFNMVQGGGSNNKQSGIFMDNGSGGFMADLVFNGGNYGAFLGSQQFTSRNLTFNNCNTAIFMNWNWLWTLKSITVNNCGVGVDMANNPPNQTVGSVLIQDSKFTGTPKGIVTAFSTGNNVPAGGGELVIDNCDFTGATTAVAHADGSSILAGGSKVASWAQGHTYTAGADGSAGSSTCSANAPSVSDSHIQGPVTAPPKPASLLDGNGNVFERSKPQYETLPSSSFISVKSKGAKGDGTTDDTAAIQAVFDSATPDQVVYFDHGAYIISNTVKVPKNIKLTGEIWPIIMASGQAFSDASKPAPVFQVGQAGDTGAVEMSDLVFQTKGPQPGAVMIEWNVAGPAGSCGMWDVHMRIGGSAGTNLQSDKCSKNPSVIGPANPACEGAFLMLHITSKGSVLLENNWFWAADHELDLADHNQINIFNGRGVLVESQGPVWMYGTASEHSQLYNYQLANAKNIYMGAIQTETPYMQSNPNALTPFTPNPTFFDPTFSACTTDSCKKSWGLRVLASSQVLIYGAGLYSFFENWDQTCVNSESCQENMVSIECSAEVYVWGLSTKASTNMVTLDGKGVVPQGDNRSNFCSTVALFEQA